MSAQPKQRILLLCTTTGYQTQSMVDAAQKLGLEVVFATDRCHVLPDPWQDGALPVRFESPDEGTARIVEYAREHPLATVVCVGDRPTPTAARVAQALGLPGHPPEAADICRDKYLSRERLRQCGLRVPAFCRFPVNDDERGAVDRVRYPCVLKPLALSGSRGVIRANNSEEFVTAFERIRTLLKSPDVGVLREETSNFIQVEEYVDGVEIAVEALMDRGRLRILAIFDKPDPLTGPYFEETIYVTPSRLPGHTQQQVAQTLAAAVRALGLYHGPLHAELRISGSDASHEVWVMEVAARPIGGLCSMALRFRIPLVDENVSLEEALIRLALGADVSRIQSDRSASGVMMIPIPAEGFYQDVHHLELAMAQPAIFAIDITAKTGQKLVPLPEGSSYLGFIFARASTPEQVEQALRAAHAKLEFVIAPALPIVGVPAHKHVAS
jgi:biotin carboxylase